MQVIFFKIIFCIKYSWDGWHTKNYNFIIEETAFHKNAKKKNYSWYNTTSEDKCVEQEKHNSGVHVVHFVVF